MTTFLQRLLSLSTKPGRGFAEASLTLDTGKAARKRRTAPPRDVADTPPMSAADQAWVEEAKLQILGAPQRATQTPPRHATPAPAGSPLSPNLRLSSGTLAASDDQSCSPARSEVPSEYQAVPPAGDGDAFGRAPTFASLGPVGHRQRMRDRILDRGTDGLADYELLEMLLFLAFKQGDTKPLAKDLINRFGSLAAVLSAPKERLMACHGLGQHGVTAILVAHASGVRLTQAEVRDQPVLGNIEKVAAYLQSVMGRSRIEQFRVLFLDAKLRLIADEVLGRGTVDHTPVYPREIIRRALDLHASGVVLAHNHPSGDPTPSQPDIEMTAEIAEAARPLSIAVHDHMIIGNGTFTSFRTQGLLER